MYAYMYTCMYLVYIYDVCTSYIYILNPQKEPYTSAKEPYISAKKNDVIWNNMYDVHTIMRPDELS